MTRSCNALVSFSARRAKNSWQIAEHARETTAELRARSRALAVIAYEVDGSYVSIDPKEGELHFPAHSPEWFEWLACLSSFRFVGKLGRFTAYRKGGYRHPSRGWAAHRFFHNSTYKHYLGITPSLMLDRLE